jgi:cysteine desulfurase
LIYLDNNATTAIDPRVVQAMIRCWETGPMNASSQHAAGRGAQKVIHQAGNDIANSLGGDVRRTGGDQLFFTSGGTEANQWAIAGLAEPTVPRWISSIEHASILEAAKHRVGTGLPTYTIPVNRQGQITAEALVESLSKILGQPLDDPSKSYSGGSSANRPRGLVSLMAANNETGVLQDLRTLVPICHRFGVLVHSDATQWVGKLPFDFAQLGIDAITFTPHKFHGPIGVGGLLVRGGVKLQPLFRGGHQQLGLRGGTEPVPLIVGMATALEIATREIVETENRVTKLRDRFEDRLQRGISGCQIHGHAVPRLPGTTSISFPGIDRQTLLIRLDRDQIACSTGSACTSGSSEPSHVLTAMGVDSEAIESALRFGLSKLSTEREVDTASERIIHCVSRLRSN